MPQKPTIPRLCQNCGAPFLARSDSVRDGNGRFCSRECGHAGRTRSLADRFWSKVEKTSGCWLWTGHRDLKGYGCIGAGKPDWTIVKAHRVSWQLHNGPIPEDRLVLHRCDNPSCVNPAHLFLGTATDNNRDRARKGRSAYGEHSGKSVLTDVQVREIRRLYASGVNRLQIAKRFGIDFKTVHSIVNRKTWTHLP